MNAAADTPVNVLPILVAAKTAAKLCGVGESLWYALDSKGAVPLPVHLNSKKLWSRRQLELWADHGCPSRTSPEWQAILAEIRDGNGDTKNHV